MARLGHLSDQMVHIQTGANGWKNTSPARHANVRYHFFDFKFIIKPQEYGAFLFQVKSVLRHNSNCNNNKLATNIFNKFPGVTSVFKYLPRKLKYQNFHSFQKYKIHFQWKQLNFLSEIPLVKMFNHFFLLRLLLKASDIYHDIMLGEIDSLMIIIVNFIKIYPICPCFDLKKVIITMVVSDLEWWSRQSCKFKQWWSIPVSTPSLVQMISTNPNWCYQN